MEHNVLYYIYLIFKILNISSLTILIILKISTSCAFYKEKKMLVSEESIAKKSFCDFTNCLQVILKESQ